MLKKLYQTANQSVSNSVVLLPQWGAAQGRGKQPFNSFAIIRDDTFVLFDAAFHWVWDGIINLLAEGRSPSASMLSCYDLADISDALGRLQLDLGLRTLLHPTDQTLASIDGCEYSFADPMTLDLLTQHGLEVVHIPGRTAGATMLYVEKDKILLAGDSVFGPAWEDGSDRIPMLQRPSMGLRDRAHFCEKWKLLWREKEIRGVLPLHGRGCLLADVGHDAFHRSIENIWLGEAVANTWSE